MKDLYFSQVFDVSPALIDDYGAFNISVSTDLPLFIDPFLLFYSENPVYQGLHEDIIRYIRFLRDRSSERLSPEEMDTWYRFPEVKQNWLGFTFLGNSGRGLGSDFAKDLNGALHGALRNFGEETISRGSHLEKLALVRQGVGRDKISDLTTNLIKSYLAEFTQAFAQQHLTAAHRDLFTLRKAEFDYGTGIWRPRQYILPRVKDDFILLTPFDILTRDDTWISYNDMIHRLPMLPVAIPNDQLRAQVNLYLTSQLGNAPTRQEIDRVSQRTINHFPELIDYYILGREKDGDQARATSAEKCTITREVLVDLVQQVVSDLSYRSDFLQMPYSSYTECLAKVHEFKHYVEDCDGYKLINPSNQNRRPSSENDIHLFFGLLLQASQFDVNQEANNGRGPVDYAVSMGKHNKSLIEVKLASNSQLKRNLQNQIEVYKKAHGTPHAVKMILYYTESEQIKVNTILTDLGLASEESVIVIDARNDNKPSASKA